MKVFTILILLTGFLAADFKKSLEPAFEKYCQKCHGSKKQKADLDISKLTSDLQDANSLESWRLIYDQLKFKEMPPEDAKDMPEAVRKELLTTLRKELLKTQMPGVIQGDKLSLPEFGNYVDHDALFNEKAGPVIPSSPRIWRLRPEIYSSFASSISNRAEVSQPFSMLPGHSFKDYSAPYYIDEPTTDLLMRNADVIVTKQIEFRVKDGKKWGKYKDFLAVTDPEKEPTEEQLAKAVELEYKLTMRRMPTESEKKSALDFWKRVNSKSGHMVASKTMLKSIILKPETLFRQELGEEKKDELGRRRLTQMEIVKAISFALDNRVENTLFSAAEKKKLSSKEEIKEHIRRILNNPKSQNPRIMKFFEEYFGYKRGIDIFKDRPKRGFHDVNLLINDIELTIKDILKKDKNILKELLTTNKFYVNFRYDSKRKTGTRFNAKDPGYETAYGLPPDWKWTDEQPVALNPKTHMGILTHPAWLVAWSDNFHNDIVRRGKWIRTHLLGGTVPDVPISVDAKVPEDEHKTLRQRLNMVSREDECWRCHKKMNPLGMPFEQFTHYGHFRKLELKKPVDTKGGIHFSGEEKTDGDVTNPYQLIQKLANSTKVEQVFIRHVFRFYVGRNETLGDAKTLQEAHKVYKESGGSFKELLISLLSSDSFLLRY